MTGESSGCVKVVRVWSMSVLGIRCFCLRMWHDDGVDELKLYGLRHRLRCSWFSWLSLKTTVRLWEADSTCFAVRFGIRHDSTINTTTTY
jgi:hypothetical protein